MNRRDFITRSAAAALALPFLPAAVALPPIEIRTHWVGGLPYFYDWAGGVVVRYSDLCARAVLFDPHLNRRACVLSKPANTRIHDSVYMDGDSARCDLAAKIIDLIPPGRDFELVEDTATDSMLLSLFGTYIHEYTAPQECPRKLKCPAQ